MNINIDLGKLIAVIGGWSVLIIGLSSWVGARLAEKLSLKWKQEYQKEIEFLKAKLSSEHELVKSSMSLFASGHQCSQERRLKAIEIMWEVMIKMRDYVSPLINYYSVLLPGEYNDVFNRKDDPFLLSSISYESNTNLISEIGEIIEKQRPFLGEYLWSLFFMYRVFLFRIVFIFIKSKDEGNIIGWYDDKNTLNIVELALSEDERLNNEYKKIGALKLIIDSMEQKVLRVSNKIISGEFASESNFNEAKKLLRAVENEILKK